MRARYIRLLVHSQGHKSKLRREAACVSRMYRQRVGGGLKKETERSLIQVKVGISSEPRVLFPRVFREMFLKIFKS